MTHPRPFVVGLGSPHGDDQAGWLVVEKLHAWGWEQADARNLSQPVDLLDWLPTDRRLLMCDAAEAIPGCSGNCRTWIWPEQSLPTLKPGGSHDLALAEILEYARQLKLHDTSVELRTIDGANWTPFSEPSEAVRAAAERLATLIHEESCRA